MLRRLFQTVPKYAFAALILLIGVGSFAFWKLKKKVEAPASNIAAKAVDDAGELPSIESASDVLVLADNDLYDVAKGQLLRRGWLKHGMPLKLFRLPGEKKFLAQYERGFIRYDLEGGVDAELPNLPAPAVADDYKWAVFSRGGDIYRVDIDWPAMKLVHERRVSAIGGFHDRFFADNIIIGTDKTLIVRNANRLVNVNMETGAVKPMDLSQQQIIKRRSPDSKRVTGLEKGNFYCYEVDTDKADLHPVGRGAINDYQWLDNGRCVAIAAMRTVILYDVAAKTLTEVAALPSPCNEIGEPSPDGRFVFCGGKGTGVLVDTLNKTATSVSGGAGIKWISGDTFAFARDIQDSDLRGTWTQKVGQEEKRVSAEPFMVEKTGSLIMAIPSSDVVVFATKTSLSKVNAHSGEVQKIATLVRPVTGPAPRAVAVQQWNN